MPRYTALQTSRSARVAAGWLGGQRRSARRPYTGARLDTHRILQAEFAEGIAKRSVVSVSRIGQYDTVRCTALPGLAQLRECDLRLGRKPDLIGYASLRPP